MSIALNDKASQELLNDKASQEDLIALHLIKHGSISSLEAIDLYGITRLAGRIWKLRHDRKWKINSVPEKGKNRYGKTVVYSRYFVEETA